MTPTYYVQHPDGSYSVADPQPSAQQETQKKHKPLFAEMIAQHPGLAEELAQQDAQAVTLTLGEMLEQSGLRDYHTPSDVAFMVAAQKFAALAMLNAAPTPPTQQDAQAVPPQQDLKILMNRLENQAHRAGELWERYQGKSWSEKESAEFTALRDVKMPQTRAALAARLNAAPTPPAQRVMLTDEEIRDLWSWSMTAEAERTANTQQHAFAQGVIEAYERKNGLATLAALKPKEES